MDSEHKECVKGIISSNKGILESDKDYEPAKGLLAGVHDAAEDRKLRYRK